jgi:probable F420-dependent oxidoreductase
VLFGFLAACTTQIELVTGVLILPQRQTALVAKQAAQVDVLSGGRLRLGVGVGWNAVEYEALNEDFRTRGTRSEEQIAVLRALWTAPAVDFHGRWHHIDAAGIKPLPLQRPIPIWIGGGADVVLERIARIGDGWFPQMYPDHNAAATLERLRAAVRAAGRSSADVGIEARLSIRDVPMDQWADYAEAWRKLGATHLGINTMGAGLQSPSDHLAVLDRVRAALKPIMDIS